jgi:hypothetical protein
MTRTLWKTSARVGKKAQKLASSHGILRINTGPPLCGRDFSACRFEDDLLDLAVLVDGFSVFIGGRVGSNPTGFSQIGK